MRPLDLERRLNNYKQMQSKVAQNNGTHAALMAAKTLTQARKAVYGEKKKVCANYKGHPEWKDYRVS